DEVVRVDDQAAVYLRQRPALQETAGEADSVRERSPLAAPAGQRLEPAAKTVFGVRCLLKRITNLSVLGGAGRTRIPPPLGGVIPDLAALDLQDQHTAGGMHDHEVRLSIGAAGAAALDPANVVKDVVRVRKCVLQCLEDACFCRAPFE